MLNRLMNGLLGRKPVEFGRRQALPPAPQLLPLAARVLDHYRHNAVRCGDDHRESLAYTEELLREVDPVDLVTSLIISFRDAAIIALESNDASRLIDGYRAVLHHGVSCVESIPVSKWQLSHTQVGAALDAYLPVILIEPHTALRSQVFLAGLLKRAVDGPADRAVHVGFIDAALQGQKHGASLIRRFIEENLPALGIARDEIPTLARWASQSRDVEFNRNHLVTDAGPHLGPVLIHLLDGGSDLYWSRSRQCSALQNLFAADAHERGKAFSHLLDLIVTADGYDNLQRLARVNGWFSHELEPPARPIPMLDQLAVELSKGKMVLTDSDRDFARLIFLLTCNEPDRFEPSRLILKQLLKTAQAHPGGQTAECLKKLVGQPHYMVWAADVREALPDRLSEGSASAEEAAVLPLVPLPAFVCSSFGAPAQLLAHFGGLFEPRLYDQAHMDYLERVAQLHVAVKALPANDSNAIGHLIDAAGVQRESGAIGYALSFLEHGYNLRELRNAFRPLALSGTGVAPKLASLSHQMENRSAPSARWLADLRAVRDTLPDETWLRHLRQMTGISPSVSLYGVPGETHLRTMIYLAAALDSQEVGTLLADYALKHCYVTVPGIGMRAEKLGNACLWSGVRPLRRTARR